MAETSTYSYVVGGIPLTCLSAVNICHLSAYTKIQAYLNIYFCPILLHFHARMVKIQSDKRERDTEVLHTQSRHRG